MRNQENQITKSFFVNNSWYSIPLIFITVLLFSYTCQAQVVYKEYKTIIDGEEITIQIRDGDTLIIAELERVSVTAPKEFEYTDDRDRYTKYRKHAAIAYPYAVQAVRLYRQLERETIGMSKKEKKKVIKQLSKRLEDEFEEPLKKLSRTQGLMLTKMIEKNLNKPFYDVIKELKGGFSAYYYNEISKTFGYKLKEIYVYGQDPVLDAVLEDFDLKKDLE